MKANLPNNQESSTVAKPLLAEVSFGWVIINQGHPRTGNEFIVTETFSQTRKKAIGKFIEGSGSDWRYWRRKWNFRAVRSTQTVSI